MEVELSSNSIKLLAMELAPKVAKIIKRELEKKETAEEWVDANEAASILKISRSRIYQIKNRLEYIKTGDKDQGKLLFKKSTLIEGYGAI